MALITTHTLTAANITLKAMNNRMQAMDCTLCAKQCCSKRQMLKHIKDKHLDAKWPCDVCGKQYDSYNGKYKHECSAHSKKKCVLHAAVDLIINHSWTCILQLMTELRKYTVKTVAKALQHDILW